MLTVTAAMFATVAVLLRGRQADAEFVQAVRDLESRVQTVVSDVRNGYYNTEGTACNAASWPPSFSSPAAESGTNTGCVFMGKAMSFLSQGDEHEIRITTMLGRQYKAGANLERTTSLADAQSVAVPNFQTTRQSYGLQVTQVRVIGENTDRGSIAFMNDLSGSVGSSNTVRLYYVNNTAFPGAAAGATVDSALDTPANFVLVTSGIRICVKGANDKVGEVTIGASGDQNSTNVWIREDNCPV